MPHDDTIRHVLMVIESDYPSMDGGGAEAQIETLTDNLPAGLQVTVVAPLVPYGPQSVQDVVQGVPVHRIWYPRLPLIGGFIMLLRLASFILARRRTTDAIHCHIAHNMAAVCSCLGCLLGIPVVVKLTGMQELENGILSENRPPGNSLRRWLIKQASAFQAISEDLENGLIDKGFDKDRIHLIPNAVDTRLFAPAVEGCDAIRKKFGIDADFVACFVGRLVPEKALDMLIRAWDQALPNEARASLVLVGTGPLEDDLTTLAGSLNRAHQVKFAGFVQDKTVIADYWRIADIGLLTSDFEGLSNALLEAMASAVPMIGSRVSGNEDLITPGETGWLFEPRQQDQLAACLSEAFDMAPASRRRMGEAARRRALKMVGVDHVWRRLASLYLDRRQEAMALCAE
jgi:glycosyltransferase involved in cell wall biosynthesis